MALRLSQTVPPHEGPVHQDSLWPPSWLPACTGTVPRLGQCSFSSEALIPVSPSLLRSEVSFQVGLC